MFHVCSSEVRLPPVVLRCKLRFYAIDQEHRPFGHWELTIMWPQFPALTFWTQKWMFAHAQSGKKTLVWFNADVCTFGAALQNVFMHLRTCRKIVFTLFRHKHGAAQKKVSPKWTVRANLLRICQSFRVKSLLIGRGCRFVVGLEGMAVSASINQKGTTTSIVVYTPPRCLDLSSSDARA